MFGTVRKGAELVEHSTDKHDKIILFQDRQIRRLWHDEEWFFSVIDIIGVLTDSTNPRDYWYKMKIRVRDEDGLNRRQFVDSSK